MCFQGIEVKYVIRRCFDEKDAERYFEELCDNEIKQSRELYERFMHPYKQSGSDEMVKQLETNLAVECQAHVKAKEKRIELADKYQIYAKYEFPYEIGSQQYKDAVSFLERLWRKKAQGFVVIHYKKFAQVTGIYLEDDEGNIVDKAANRANEIGKAIENDYVVSSKSYQVKHWNGSLTEFLCEIEQLFWAIIDIVQTYVGMFLLDRSSA